MANTDAEPTDLTHSYIAIRSTDSRFMSSLIKWLSQQPVKRSSTVIRVCDTDPFEEVDLLRAQIEGMTVRMQDAERKVAELSNPHPESPNEEIQRSHSQCSDL